MVNRLAKTRGVLPLPRSVKQGVFTRTDALYVTTIPDKSYPEPENQYILGRWYRGYFLLPTKGTECWYLRDGQSTSVHYADRKSWLRRFREMYTARVEKSIERCQHLIIFRWEVKRVLEREQKVLTKRFSDERQRKFNVPYELRQALPTLEADHQVGEGRQNSLGLAAIITH